MPRTKSATASATPRKPKTIKRSVTRTIRPVKKTKSVLVDVIEDEPLLEEAAI